MSTNIFLCPQIYFSTQIYFYVHKYIFMSTNIFLYPQIYFLVHKYIFMSTNIFLCPQIYVLAHKYFDIQHIYVHIQYCNAWHAIIDGSSIYICWMCLVSQVVNKIKRTSRLGRLLALSLEILNTDSPKQGTYACDSIHCLNKKRRLRHSLTSIYLVQVLFYPLA